MLSALGAPWDVGLTHVRSLAEGFLDSISLQSPRPFAPLVVLSAFPLRASFALLAPWRSWL